MMNISTMNSEGKATDLRRKAWLDVRILRNSRGWPQWQAAEALGVTREYLSAIENGKRGISLRMMDAIIRVFDVKYEDFFR